MSETGQPSADPNRLFLAGRLQFEAAVEALGMTGADPGIEAVLAGLLEDHRRLMTPMATGLIIGLPGELGVASRANIVASALLVEQNQNLSPEARAAAAGLLDVLGIER